MTNKTFEIGQIVILDGAEAQIIFVRETTVKLEGDMWFSKRDLVECDEDIAANWIYEPIRY